MDYPTIKRLADPAQTTTGYQGPVLVEEAVSCYRALQRRDALLREAKLYLDMRKCWELRERIQKELSA